MAQPTKTRPRRARTEAHAAVEPGIGLGPATAIFFALALFYFAPAFLPGRHLFGTDYLAGGFFFYDFVSERLAAGALPKWVPYIYGGIPHLANPGSTFYPVRLFADFLFPVTWILPFIFVVQFWAAGVGMYLLARELGCRSWVAFVVGIAFQFTGITVSAVYAGHDGRVIAATFAPLVFYFLHRGIRTGRLAPFVGASATIGFSLLSFQIQSNYYLLVAGLLWAIFCLVHLGYTRDPAGAGRRIALGLGAVAFAFTLAAVNFLPFIDYIPESPRGAEGGRGYEYSVSWSMPPGELLSIAVPESAGVLENYQGENPFKLHTEYVGALLLLLLVLGIRFVRENRYWWFFAALALFTLTIAFGGHTPIYRLYYELLPGTQRFRAPSISFFLFSFSLATMAAITLERMARARDSRDEGAGGSLIIWLGGSVAVAVAAALIAAATGGAEPRDAARVAGFWRFALFLAITAGALHLWWSDRLRTLGLVVALAAVTFADLWVVNRNFFETVPPPEVTFAADDVVHFLQSQGAEDRVWALPFPAPYQGGGNYLMHFGIEQAGGESGNQLQRFNEYVGAGEEVYVDWSNLLEYPNFMNAANVRFIVSMMELDTPFLREVHRGSALVYENANALPRAWVVGEVQATRDSTAALSALQDPSFDPARTAVVYTDEPLSLPQGPLEATARIVDSTPDRVVIQATADRPALLVLADNLYDGWRATVNGVEAPVLRTNHTFRGVRIDAGESEVVFEFRPADLYTGLYIYLACLLLLAAYGVWLLVQWRRGARPAGSPA